MTIELEPQVFEACLEQLGTSLTAVAETERGHADTLPRGTQHIGQEMLVRFSIRAAGFGSAVDRQLPPEGMEGEALTRWLADELNRVLREVQRTATPKAMVEILRAMHQLVVRRGNRMEVPVPPLALDEVGVSTRRVVVRRSTTPARPVAVPPAPAQPHAPAVADESVAPPTRESPRPPARREETIETLMGKVEAEIKTLLQSLQGVPMDHLLVVPSRVMSDHFSATVAALRVAECYGGKFEKAQAAAQTYASSIDDLVKQLPSARAKHQFRLAVAAMERKAFSAPVCYLAVESGGKEHLTKQTAIKLDQIRRGIEQFRRRGEEANALVLILGMAGRAAWGEGDSPSPVLNLAKLDALKKEVAEAVAENQDMEVADILAAIDALPGYLDDQDGLVHGRQLLQRIHEPGDPLAKITADVWEDILQEIIACGTDGGFTGFLASFLDEIEKGINAFIDGKYYMGIEGKERPITSDDIPRLKAALAWRAPLIEMQPLLRRIADLKELLAQSVTIQT